MHQRFLRTFATLVLCPASLSVADPPKIERLFPPGGQRGTTVEAKVFGAAGGEVPQVWSSLGQLALEFNEKKDAVTVSIPEDAVPGLHWLRFYNSQGSTDLRPFIVGLVPEAKEVEPNNKPADAQALDVLPVTVNGVLEKTGDVDLYGMTLKAGQTLVASMQAHRDLASPMDGVLQILDDHGTVVAFNDDDHGFDPQIVYRIPKDGVYYARTFAFPATPNSTIRMAGAATYVYRLTLTCGPFVDHTVPAVVNGSTENTVELRGWNLGATPRTIQLPAVPDDATVISNDVALPVRLSRVAYPTLVETAETSLSLSVPSAATGAILQASETDEYTFVGKKGQSLTVSVSARSMDSLLDPVLSVSAADGKSIKAADDRSGDDLDADASFKIPADGTYHITVTDRFGKGGFRYVYLLTIEETQPTFTATLKSNAFVLADGKPLEIPVTIGRDKGFAESVTLTVADLPKGVTAEPVVSEPKEDTAKAVTLKLTRQDTAAAFSGNIQIVTTSTAESEPQLATAPIKDASVTTTDLWLTVIAAEVPEAAKEKAAEQKPTEEK